MSIINLGPEEVPVSGESGFPGFFSLPQVREEASKKKFLILFFLVYYMVASDFL